MNLTIQNRNTLQEERRIAYVFSGIVIAFGSLFNLIYFMLSEDINGVLILLINLGIFTLSFLISHSMNKQLNQDLKEDIKTIRIEKVQKKEIVTCYEAGSGTLNIPLLAFFFPKLWGQEMRASYKWILFINGFRYEVNQDVFDNVKVGENVEMHYANNSDTLLEIALPFQPSRNGIPSEKPMLSRMVW